MRPEVPKRCRWVSLRPHAGIDESGFSLAEVLLTVIILGIAVVALVSGLAAAIGQSDFHRKDAVEDALLRTYAENIKSAVLSSCPQNAGGTFSATKPPSTPKYNPLTPTLSNSSCPAPTTQLTLTASSTDGRTSASLIIVIAVP